MQFEDFKSLSFFYLFPINFPLSSFIFFIMNFLNFLQLDIYDSLNIGGFVDMVNSYLFRIYDETNIVNSFIFSLFLLLLTKVFTSTKTTCKCRFLCYINILVEAIVSRLIVNHISIEYIKLSVRLNRSTSLFFFIFYLFYSHFTYSDRVNILTARITKLEYEQKFLVDSLYGSLRRSLSNSFIKTKPVKSSNPADLISDDEN